MEGWVSIYRTLAKSNLWLKQKFTKGQAWIDMILLANHKDGVIEKRGNQISIKRGQLGWSELALSYRWKWSRNKTTRFLKWLENEQQIIQHRSRITTLITIVNYNKYQNINNKMIQQKIQQKDNRIPKTIQQKDTNNNDNKINKNIHIAVLNYWNSQKIIIHKKIDEATKGKINAKIVEGYSQKEIKDAIRTYAVILKNDKYYWSHAWTLKEFLQRGFEKFKDREIAANNYINTGRENDNKNTR